ncbi:TMEM175 family protein [Lentilactobacillus sp. TOM.63]|uniref:TMEM175 family protein n=1 Tax=Lentilactobacillus TaxID=2767893 RepID=UPI00201BE164|nr:MULTISPECIES: TMEM175 family protein [Lentilactobacillus]MDM7516131.1 TMEM175 family protein [Lentilactobacillus sp. TOM.63]
MFKADRIRAMSDGLFAILITILVLDFKLPDYQAGHLLAAVGRQWPIMLAYVVSFSYIGTLWLFHHDFFSTIDWITPELNIINLLVLFSITLINYATSLISAALSAMNLIDLRTAIIIYDGCALFISFTFELMYRYSYRHPELTNRQRSANEGMYFIKSDPIISVVIYLISIVTSFFSVVVGGIFLLAGIIWHAIAYVRLTKK